MGFWILILFPLNGLLVVYLWSLTMCNLIKGYVVTKNKNYLIGLAALCFVNAFYIPTVLNYEFLEHVAINLPFWIGNLILAIVISIMSLNQRRSILPFKSLILYPFCMIWASFIVENQGDFSIYGLLYLIVAVVIVPVCYYVYAKNQPVKIKDVSLSNTVAPKEIPIIKTCPSCGEVVNGMMCGSCNELIKNVILSNVSNADVPEEKQEVNTENENPSDGE